MESQFDPVVLDVLRVKLDHVAGGTARAGASATASAALACSYMAS